MAEKKLSTANYKGSRDFYPEDMDFRNWMFSTMRRVVESFGYREYDGPILEFIDLYRAKSGQEIVDKQLYDFIDKGDRHVAIRPEMTPTLARMVAARVRELPRPIRWFSIPNLWRYEAPGHGRLREHWQLNVDLFGVNSIHAEVEIISLATEILFAFGAPRSSFRVRYSHRGILTSFLRDTLSLPPEREQAVAKILDKQQKISPEEFTNSISELLNRPEVDLPLIRRYLGSDAGSLADLEKIDPRSLEAVRSFQEKLREIGLEDLCDFDPSIIRGFDYYTGFIFEIFDTNPENRRSLYGGGRYDNLIGLFSGENLSGIGFGLGDVTLENFLRTHKLVPDFTRTGAIYLALLDNSLLSEAMKLSSELRAYGLVVETALDGGQKLGKQLQNAEKKGFRNIFILGGEEVRNGKVTWKDLQNSTQREVERDKLLEILRQEGIVKAH